MLTYISNYAAQTLIRYTHERLHSKISDINRSL